MGMNRKIVRMKRVEGRLSKEGLSDKARARLEARLGSLKNDTAKAAAPFPRLASRLARVEAELEAATDNPALRGDLEKRRDRLRRRLAIKRRKAKQRGAGGGDGGKDKFPKLANRLRRVLARLETVEDEGERAQLEERRAFLEKRIRQKSLRKDGKRCARGNLADRTRELLEEKKAEIAFQLEGMVQGDEDPGEKVTGDAAPVPATATGVRRGKISAGENLVESTGKPFEEQAGGVALQLAGTIQGKGDEGPEEQDTDDATAVPTAAAEMHPRRADQKKRLIEMEKQARGNNRQKQLALIALQQVYVAHFPDDTEYVPLFDIGGEGLSVQRAALRRRALESALGGAVSGQGVADWIAEDMYGRLPREWSLDDEIAMFGGGGGSKQNRSDKKAGRKVAAGGANKQKKSLNRRQRQRRARRRAQKAGRKIAAPTRKNAGRKVAAEPHEAEGGTDDGPVEPPKKAADADVTREQVDIKEE